MKDTFTDYLRDLGMGALFVGRVTELHDECRSLSLQELEEILVSEQFHQGQRSYIALHFFAVGCVFRFKNFVDRSHVEVRRLDGVSRFELFHADFDLRTGTASAKSILHVVPSWEPVPFSLQLSASRDNCAHLLGIVKKYFLPQLIENYRTGSGG